MRVGDKNICGKWMPRAKDYCGLYEDHTRKCLSTRAVATRRERQAGYTEKYRQKYPGRIEAAQKASKDKNRTRERKRTLEHDTSIRSWLATVKLTAGCADCGYKDHAVALDFDHLPGFEKSFNIARSTWRARHLIEAEVAKCEVVCANCHRIRSYNRLMEKLRCPVA